MGLRITIIYLNFEGSQFFETKLCAEIKMLILFSYKKVLIAVPADLGGCTKLY